LVQAESVLGLTGASQHRLYPVGLVLAATREALRGDFDTVEPRCREAVAAVRRLGSDPDHLVDERLSVVRSLVAIGLGAHDEAATHLQHAAEAAHSAGRFGAAALQLSAAAIERMLAADANAAALLATEALDLAHRVGTPIAIEQSLLALAGALAEQDPVRAKALLRERSSLHASVDYQSFTEPTQAVLVSGRLQDWTAVLDLAPAAIWNLHWSGSWPQLAAVFNIVARALASSDTEGAAVLQGAARRLALTAIVPPASSSAPTHARLGDRQVGDGGLITQLRRDTTGLLLERLGDARLHELRAQGDAMDDDHAAAYALDAIARVRQLEAQR
jgi:hypothetical protein